MRLSDGRCFCLPIGSCEQEVLQHFDGDDTGDGNIGKLEAGKCRDRIWLVGGSKMVEEERGGQGA